GGYVTLKIFGPVSVPARVVTVMCPSLAPPGTVVTISVAVWETTAAGVPLNDTRDFLVKFWPVMVTVVPTVPEFGLMESIAGVTLGVIRPIAFGRITRPSPSTVNHIAQSDPTAIPACP